MEKRIEPVAERPPSSRQAVQGLERQATSRYCEQARRYAQPWELSESLLIVWFPQTQIVPLQTETDLSATVTPAPTTEASRLESTMSTNDALGRTGQILCSKTGTCQSHGLERWKPEIQAYQPVLYVRSASEKSRRSEVGPCRPVVTSDRRAILRWQVTGCCVAYSRLPCHIMAQGYNATCLPSLPTAPLQGSSLPIAIIGQWAGRDPTQPLLRYVLLEGCRNTGLTAV
jgi:hypothetical protein